MTYYGWRVVFRFKFACGCRTGRGPIFEKFAYQYAGLGAPQKCGAHGAPEVEREVEKIDGPHGEYALGWWTRQNGTRIFLEWEPATGWVTLNDKTERPYPVHWRQTRLVNITVEAVIWRLVGGNHLGGDRPEPAEEIIARFLAAGEKGPNDG